MNKTGDISIKRKPRYLVVLHLTTGDIVRQARYFTRPELEVEEEEQPDGSFKIISQKWLPCTMAFDEFSSSPNSKEFQEFERPFCEYFSEVYEASEKPSFSDAKEHKIQIAVEAFDGEGEKTEKWALNNAWPQYVGFGDLSGDECILEVSWTCESVEYENLTQT